MPDPAAICRPGETPAALYEWLFFGPGLYFQTLPAIGKIYASLAPDGCMLFSKGTTEESAAILTKMGFVEAQTLYPSAPSALVALLPQKDLGTAPAARPRRQIDVRQVRDFEGLAHVFSIRSATYLAEQFPLYAEEFDGNDFCATHFVGYVNGDPAGAVRLRYFADFVKCERLAVKMEYRKSRLAFMLVKTAIEHMRQKGFTRAYGHASDEIAPFWRLMGARPLEDRPAFSFANIEYREMVAEFEPDPLAIRLGAAPMVTIRPEGAWDEPAPLDWSNVNSDPDREALMTQFMPKKKLQTVTG
jgi:predicted GNAT family N-acyltransferase